MISGHTTKKEFIESAGHRNIIKRELLENNWPADQRVYVFKGLDIINPTSKMARGSNLTRALDASLSREYIKGGSIRKRDGWWFCVKM